MLALRDGFAVTDCDGSPLRWLRLVEADRDETRMNDGACDRHGRLCSGRMHVDGAPGYGSLYRLDPDGTVTRVLTGVGVSNGIGWSPDDSTMYYADTVAGGVDAFDFDLDAGTIANRRRSCTLRPRDLTTPTPDRHQRGESSARVPVSGGFRRPFAG